jgi:hypothetical protein
MTAYLHNLARWARGVRWLWSRDVTRLPPGAPRPTHAIRYRPGWNPWKFLPWYLLDIGPNVLTGGAVETLSAMMHRHRDGWAWDKILDVIEHVDPEHGETAASYRPLWGSVELPVRQRVAICCAWAVVLWWAAS